MVREACSCPDCMFSASKASQANVCFSLLEISRCIHARVEYGIGFKVSVVFWNMFLWLLGWHGVGGSSVNRYGILINQHYLFYLNSPFATIILLGKGS